MNTFTLSARLRHDIQTHLGTLVLNALMNHIHEVNTDQFDPRVEWEVTSALELSELAHRLSAYAAGIESTNPTKLEATRLSKAIMTHFTAVYDVAMERLNPQPCPYAAMLKG